MSTSEKEPNLKPYQKPAAPLVIQKTIYAKHKGKFTVEMQNEILKLEVTEHLRKYPELEYSKCELASKKDGTAIYNIHFEKIQTNETN